MAPQWQFDGPAKPEPECGASHDTPVREAVIEDRSSLAVIRRRAGLH
jgi:hypothetical protein